jgi:hypothetical protein
VEELPAAVPVLDPLLLPEAPLAPVVAAADPDACDGSWVRDDPGTDTDDEALTEAVLEPYSCSEE